MPLILALSLMHLSAPAQAKTKNLSDTEFGLRLEAPLASNPNVVEQSFGAGESQLHLGYEGEIAQALSSNLYLLTRVGTRRQYLRWQQAGMETRTATVETRAMRLLLGLQYSFLEPPTFLVLSASAGLTSSFWVARVGAGFGDRKALGANGTVGVGVDHFVSTNVALSLELRGWAEQHQIEQMSAGGWAFESPGWRQGVSLLVGVKLR